MMNNDDNSLHSIQIEQEIKIENLRDQLMQVEVKTLAIKEEIIDIEARLK